MPDPETVFKIERADGVVVVRPQGPALHFNHNEVHLESNALYRAVDDPKFRHVLVDLSDVDYIDSVIISSVLRCLTKTKQKRGKAVFCCASENMRELLKCIKFGKLWPEFETRAQAVQFVLSD
ncbi:MAG: STAS domain-containing protein [Planctomycetaceae bacterium]